MWVRFPPGTVSLIRSLLRATKAKNHEYWTAQRHSTLRMGMRGFVHRLSESLESGGRRDADRAPFRSAQIRVAIVFAPSTEIELLQTTYPCWAPAVTCRRHA